MHVSLRSRMLSVSFALALVAGLFFAQAAFAADIYVDAFTGDDLIGTGARTAPYATVGAGLDAAVSGDTVIAGMGIYPERIQLKSGVALEGAGQGRSILWGSHRGKVVEASTISDASISGFTVSGGRTTGYGAGIFCTYSTLTVRDCEITDNEAVDPTNESAAGGGVFVQGSTASMVIEGCTITENVADIAGGIVVYLDAAATIRDCIISDNTALGSAGGIIVTHTGGTISIERCAIENNVANDDEGYGGGGVYIIDSPASVTNCLIAGNSSVSNGGGVFDYGTEYSATITNCTIVDNDAGLSGGGVYRKGASPASYPIITNCIIWGNGDDLNRCSATYSCVEDGDAGTGNTSSDPRFMSASDYRLMPGSPCIDSALEARAPLDDLEGTARPIDGDRDGAAVADRGAYEAWGADTTAPDDPALSSATHPQDTWVSGTEAIVTITAPSDFSGIAGYSVEWSEGHAHTPDTSIDLAGTATQATHTLTEGEWYVSVRAVDGAGNWSAGTTYGPMRVDSVVPTVLDDAPAGWQSEPVTVTITAEDLGAGLASVNATATDPPPGGMRGFVSAGQPLSIGVSDEGTTTIVYAAVDDAWNMSTPVLRTVLIDSMAPGVALTPDESSFNDVAVFSIEATDGVSGVASVHFTVDDRSEQTTSSVTVDTVGTHSIEYWAVDVAGNESAHQTREFQVSASTTTYIAVAGPDRFATSAAASRRSFPGGVDTVVIATGRDWPDAMGGAALAGAYDAPILLADTGSLPTTVTAEIERLGATKAFVLGGESAVGSAVIEALETVGIAAEDIERIGGANRYETARLVADAAIEQLGADYDGTAFVTTGVAFPDALAAAPLAAAKGWPVYLAKPGGDTMALTSTMKAAGVTDAVALGGEAAVPSAYFDTLNVGLDSAVRVAGSDRYATSVAIARFGVENAGLAWDGLGVTTGVDFPDALAGGVLCARNGSVMLLTKPLSLPASVAEVLGDERDVIGMVYHIGGTGSVGDVVRDEVTQILR